MRAYVVRLDTVELARRQLAGVAEEVDSGDVTPFRGTAELVEIFLSTMRTDSEVPSTGAENSRLHLVPPSIAPDPDR